MPITQKIREWSSCPLCVKTWIASGASLSLCFGLGYLYGGEVLLGAIVASLAAGFGGSQAGMKLLLNRAEYGSEKTAERLAATYRKGD